MVAAQSAVLAVQRRHLADAQVHLLVGHQRAHLLHGMGSAAKLVAPMQQRQALATGCRLSTQSSAESPPPTISTSLPRKSSMRRTE